MGDVTRPGVDVVIPFVGSQQAFDDLLERLSRLELGEADSLTVADNRPDGGPPPALAAPMTVVHAPERRSSYFARNRGARAGDREWILFLDADVKPPPDLLDRYFAEPPGPRTAVLAGAIVDEGPQPDRGQGIAARYASHHRHFDQEHTLVRGRWSYAQTGNCVVRRSAFQAVGGFVDDIRSGGDADLCFRLRDAGWAIERREQAAIVHPGQQSVGALLRQVFRHGSGATWLNRIHPGCLPPKQLRTVVARGFRASVSALYRLLRLQPALARLRLVEALARWAFALGRLGPNRAR